MRVLFTLLLLGGVVHADSFVRTQGASFVVDGAPFVFVGANVDTFHRARTKTTLAQTLDAVKADGLTVIRVWALGEGPADAPAWQRDQLFRAGPTGFIETSYQALDEVLVAAHARGLRVMLTLVNNWPDFGGVRQYLEWAGLPTKGYGSSDRFYDDATIRATVLAHVERLVSRVSSVTGQRYADDPTIFAWELMNESQVESEDGSAARRRFITDVTAFIRARDPNHLVTSGVVGYGTRAERSEWRTICALPEVDFCDSHFYPQAADRVEDRRALDQHVDDRVQLAHFVIGKPIVFGELGLDTRVEHDNWLGRPRAQMFEYLLSRFARDRVDGAMLWIYQPWGGRPRDYGIYVDRAETDDVRAVVRRFANGIASRAQLASNPRLGTRWGDALVYPAYQVMHTTGAPTVRTEDGATLVDLGAQKFATGRFERVGTWDGSEGLLPHAFGAGDGYFEWRFTGHASARLTLRARLSSEAPGTEAPPDGGSIVTASIDGQVVSAFEVVTDDGMGDFVELTFDDPTLLRRLAVGVHRLRLEVPPGPRAHGLCVYGAKGETPGDVTLRFSPAR